MKNVKIIATTLFYITRLLAILYLATTLYSIISLLTEWNYFTKDNGKHFTICFPFTETPFLYGDYNWAYIIFKFIVPM